MWSNLRPALLFILLSVIGFSIAELNPESGVGQLAVIYPMNSNFEHNFQSAVESGVFVVREGLFSNILIVQSRDGDIIPKLRKHGAIAIINPLVEGSCNIRIKSL